MRLGNVRVGKNCIRVFLSLLMVCFLFSVGSTRVSASGWIDKTDAVCEKLYGTPDMTGPEVQVSEPGETGWFEQIISDLIASLAKEMNSLLSNRDIDLSIDGIVFGRMAATLSDRGYVEADFTHFGLEENNPWGIVGATIFYALRNICLVVLPIILLAFLILELFHNTGKGRARLKEMAMHTVYVFGLLFLLPYALDLFIHFRDVVLYSVYNTMNSLVVGISGGAAESQGVIEMMIEVVEQDKSILSALVLLASVCAGGFFLFDYIRIALLLTIAFGIFPLVAVMSFWNNKKLSDWSNVFFPNLLVPFIDMLLVLIPTFLQALFVRIFGHGFSTVLVGLIIIIVIWNVVAVRNRIVKLLGFDGIGGGTGIGQMLETLSHLRSGKKEEKATEKPEGDKKEEGSLGTAGVGAGSVSHYGTSNPAVDSVVSNESVNSSETDASGSEVDRYLNQMEDPAVVRQVTAPGMDEAKENTGQSGQATDTVVNEGATKTAASDFSEKEKSSVSTSSKNTEKLLNGAGKIALAGAKTAGATVAGTTAAFAAGYGGVGASVGAGIIGAHGGSKLPEATMAGVDAYGKGKQYVKDAVFSAYRNSHEIPGDDVKKNIQKQVKFEKEMQNFHKNANQGVIDAAMRSEELEKQRRQKQDELNNKSSRIEL